MGWAVLSTVTCRPVVYVRVLSPSQTRGQGSEHSTLNYATEKGKIKLLESGLLSNGGVGNPAKLADG